MLVNLTDVFSSEGKVIERECTFERTELPYEGVPYPIQECSPVQLKLTNIGIGKVVVEAALKVKAVLLCDRCLSEVEHEFDLQFSRDVVSPDKASEEELEEQEGFMEGYELNIDDLINNEIMT